MFVSKRRLTLFITIFCLAFMTACSTPDSSEDRNTIPNDTADNNDNTADNNDDTADTTGITVEEQVLVDENDIVITLKSITEDTLFGPALNILIENNSDKGITVQTRESSINDVMIDAMLSSDVEPQKKANDEIIFMSSNLEDANISTIKDIEFSFHIFESDSWDDIFDTDIIKITTNADPGYVQTYDDSGTVVLDENDLKVVMKKVNSEDSFWGADIYMYIENNSDENLTVQARDVSINGFMIDPIFSSEVSAGKKAYDTITFLDSDLIDNDIETIDEIELSFHVFDSEDWMESYDSSKVSVTFE